MNQILNGQNPKFCMRILSNTCVWEVCLNLQKVKDAQTKSKVNIYNIKVINYVLTILSTIHSLPVTKLVTI